MDMNKLFEKAEEIYLIFPTIKITQFHQLKYGVIGPASLLTDSYPNIVKILPALNKIIVNDNKLADPVLAVSKFSFDKFFSEIEVLEFLCDEDDLFCDRILIKMFNNEGEHYISLNRYAIMPIDTINNVELRDFPSTYKVWDTDRINQFEGTLCKTINGALYKAIVRCMEDDSDKEQNRERRRILLSIMLYNQSYHKTDPTNPFPNTQIIFVASAFEALLNLPSESIVSSFEHIVSTLTGKKTVKLKKWCKDFYDYRSGLVHGDLDWESNLRIFSLSGKDGNSHYSIACDMFIYCLKTKLFLMGYYPDYNRDQINIDEVLGL